MGLTSLYDDAHPEPQHMKILYGNAHVRFDTPNY